MKKKWYLYVFLSVCLFSFLEGNGQPPVFYENL